jgi:CHAT domain-containing protein
LHIPVRTGLVILLLVPAVLQAWAAAPATAARAPQKATTSEAEEEAFSPPPRRIDDIIKILSERGNFEGNTESYKTKADAPPPTGATKESLTAFYKERALAAWHLGRYRQTLKDFETARDYAGESRFADPEFMMRLAQAELDAGNFQRGIEILQQNIQRSNDIYSYQSLVSAYTRIGDIDNAKKTEQEGRSHCSIASDARRGRGGNSKMSSDCRAMEAQAEAAILEAQGKYAAAEQPIRSLVDLAGRRGVASFAPGVILRRRLSLARNLYNQGRFFESEVAARNILKESLAHGGQESAQTFSAILIISSNLAAQGRTEDAEKLLSAAIKILEASGVTSDSAMAAQVRANYGGLLAAQGDFKRAMEQFDLVKAGMQGNRYLYEKGYARNESLLLSLILTGRTQEALGLVNDNYESFRKLFGDDHMRTAEMLALRAMAYTRMNNFKQAGEDFSGSMRVLMRHVSDRGGYIRRQRIKIIIQDYMRFLERIRGTPLETALAANAAALSFRLAELTRGQTVQSALLANSARAAEHDPETVSLIRKEQDTLKEIDVTEASILEIVSAPLDQHDPQLIKHLDAKLDHLRKARTAMMEEIQKRSPKYAGFVNPQPPLPSVVQERLHPYESLVSIFSLEDRTYVWAVPHTGRVSFASVALPKKELDAIVSRLRSSLDPKPSTMSDIPPYDTDGSYALYEKLLLPVREGWKDARDLLVIANEPLSRLPLDVLTTAPFKRPADEKLLFDSYRKAPWLIGQVSITMVPSASSLISLRSLPEGPSHRKAFAGFGDPIFSPEQLQLAAKESGVKVRGVRLTSRGGIDAANPSSSHLESLDRLPDTADEIRSIAATLKADMDRDIFLGKDASETRVKSTNLSDRQVVAFATHALMPGDLDGLDQPALALSSPTVTGNKEDGLLTTSEIMKLKLNADWVVLSACETGGAEGSDEALSGLGRAFFYAGTRAVLATMYPIETTSAKKLITRLFRDQTEHERHTRAQALRQAMLALIDDPGYVDPSSQKAVASFAHPFFWAPFVLYGDGGKAPQNDRR